MLINKITQTLVGADLSALRGFHDIPHNLLIPINKSTLASVLCQQLTLFPFEIDLTKHQISAKSKKLEYCLCLFNIDGYSAWQQALVLSA
jgi:hypothetical protein